MLYLRAEFDNFKKQSIKEKSDLLLYAGERMAFDLLNTLDVFEKALDQDVNESNYKNFIEGISLTAEQLKSDLKKHGIEEIKCKGKPFDPNTCEALSQIPAPDATEGEILEIMRKGFMFRNKVLRYAQVVTATAISAFEASETPETSEASKTPETFEASETSKTPETSETFETPETSKTPETFEASETPETSETEKKG